MKKNIILSLVFAQLLMSCGSDTTASKSSQKTTETEKKEASSNKLCARQLF